MPRYKYLSITIIVVKFLTTINLAVSCSPQEFQCTSSHCIPGHLKCNGEDDCDDSSDEINCTNRKKCEEEEFECLEGICISSALVCNGQMDCPRGLDEMKCVVPPTQPPTSPPKFQGIFRTADGKSVISFPIFERSPGFRIYLRFTAHECIGHLLEITSQTTDEFFLFSLTNNGNIDLFFKSSLGPGLITIPSPPGVSFCNGKRNLLTIKRNLDKIEYRMNRRRYFSITNMLLSAPFPRMSKINVGFGLEGCVSGVDLMYYSNTGSHSVGVSKGCVFTDATKSPTRPASTLKTSTTMVTSTSMRNRIRKESELGYSHLPSLTTPSLSTVTQLKPVTQPVTTVSHTATIGVTNDVTHSTDRTLTATETERSSTKVSTTQFNRSTATGKKISISTTHESIRKSVVSTSMPPVKSCTPLPSVCASSGIVQKTYLKDHKALDGELEIHRFLPFIRANCSAFLRTFLCAFYFPPCSVPKSTAAKPCRELCLKTKNDCSSLMNAFEFEWPESLSCDKLQSKAKEDCLMPETTKSRTVFKMTELNTTSRCGGILKRSKGLITSPNYPRPYPPDITCQWAIILPGIYHAINIFIEDASLESEKHCGYDYIMFKDGLSNQVREKMCGFLEYPRLVTIKGNIAVIVFKSDSGLNKKGFLIKYSAHWK